MRNNLAHLEIQYFSLVAVDAKNTTFDNNSYPP
jgi:hypothetical protein